MPMKALSFLTLLAALGGLSPLAAGQPSSTSRTAPSRYESAFADYRRFNDQSVGDWRASNDLVLRIGGWQAYARESQDGTKPAPPSPRDTTTSQSPDPAHDAHHQ
jgi:hypothetical protein